MNGGIVLDILLGAVFAYCVYKGMKNGFVRSIASLAATVLSLLVAFAASNALAGPVSDFLIAPPLGAFLENRMSEGIGREGADALANVVTKLQEGLGKLTGDKDGEDQDSVPASGTGQGVTPPLSSRNDDTDKETGEKSVSDVLAASLGSALAGVILFILIFALALAILRVLVDSLRVLDRIPVVGTVNTMLGMVLGAVTGTAVLFVPVWLAVAFLPKALGTDSLIPLTLLEESWILGFLSNFYTGVQGGGAAVGV